MNGTTAYALSKKYVEDTSISLGAVKGAPCTIKSQTETDDSYIVTFEWTGTSGAKETSQLTIKKPKDGIDGLPGKNGKDGQPGADGYTPVKGTDYWTADDKAEIQSYIDSQIGGALNGSY